MLKTSYSVQACKVLEKVIAQDPARYVYEVSYRQRQISEKDVPSEFDDDLKSLIDAFSACGLENVLETSKFFLAGLNKVAVLWSERWLHGLISILPHLHKSMAKLKSEIQILSNNKSPVNEMRSFLRESYDIARSPFLSDLTRLCQLTVDRDPSTANEETFKQNFEEAIRSTINRLSSDEFVFDPMRAFECIKEVCYYFI
jgi:hypothetical protein